jgi:hypothetical protein
MCSWRKYVSEVDRMVGNGMSAKQVSAPEKWSRHHCYSSTMTNTHRDTSAHSVSFSHCESLGAALDSNARRHSTYSDAHYAIVQPARTLSRTPGKHTYICMYVCMYELHCCIHSVDIDTSRQLASLRCISAAKMLGSPHSH